MKPSSSLTPRLVVDLDSALDGWADPVAFCVDLDGRIYVAARESVDAHEMETPKDYIVICWHEGDVRKVIRHQEVLPVSFVQPILGGILLAGARCAWRPASVEQNALVMDWTGRELRRMTLGDGIQDVRVTPERYDLDLVLRRGDPRKLWMGRAWSGADRRGRAPGFRSRGRSSVGIRPECRRHRRGR
jgi:hypothetical protein